MISYVIPLLIISILLFSVRKTEVYSAFCEGAAKGLKTVVCIFPAILAVLVLTAMLRTSGLFDMLLKLLSPITSKIGIPEAVVPLALLRPLSGGASLGLLSDILNNFGADSVEGRIASVVMGSAETTFYTLCVYFRNTRIKYTKKIIPAAIIGDIVGLLAAVFACKIIF